MHVVVLLVPSHPRATKDHFQTMKAVQCMQRFSYHIKLYVSDFETEISYTRALQMFASLTGWDSWPQKWHQPAHLCFKARFNNLNRRWVYPNNRSLTSGNMYPSMKGRVSLF